MSALEQMRVFVAVVERGSFVAASRALEVPRSTVSRRVADLEERLASGCSSAPPARCG
jgi:DNA-binding transcriptional LysR family regulator